MIRSEIIFPNITIAAFAKFMDNFSNGKLDKEAMANLKLFKMLEEKSANEKVFYILSKVPMMSDRDLVMHFKKEQLTDDKMLVVVKSVEHPQDPKTKGAVRMEQYKASLVETIGKDIRITEFSNINMRGYFPMRLLNMVMAQAISK